MAVDYFRKRDRDAGRTSKSHGRGVDEENGEGQQRKGLQDATINTYVQS